MPDELMANNELLMAQDCYWDSGLWKRNGYEQYESNFTASADTLRGSIRDYLGSGATSSGWYTILARDSGTNVLFYHMASDTATMIASGSVNFQTGYDVQFDKLNGQIIGVNGQDDPVIIYGTSTITIQTLDEYDSRERGTSTWWAGQYWASATGVASQYVADTTNLQSSATNDFNMVYTTASNGGFWVACDYNFTKLVIKNTSQLTCNAGFVTDYQYYKGSGTWGSCTMIASASWASSTGTRTLEWDWPDDWVPGDGDLDTTATRQRYVFRVSFKEPPTSTQAAGQASVTHSQYLTQVLNNGKPQAVCAHIGRWFLAEGNIAYPSEYLNPGKGWELRRAEYFRDGGKEITQMVSFKNYLLVMKPNAVYGLFGNSFDTFTRQKLLSNIGTNAPRSVVSTGDEVWWADEKHIWIFDGNQALQVQKHIQADYDSWASTNAAGINLNGHYFLSFPSSSIALRADPDTFRRDDAGDGRVSFFKYTNYPIYQYYWAEDTNVYYGLVNNTGSEPPRVVTLETGYSDIIWGASTTITMIAQTPYRSFIKDFMGTQRVHRISVKMEEPSTSAAATCTFAFIADNDKATASIVETFATGSAFTSPYYTLPYTVDGETLSLYFKQTGAAATHLRGWAMDVQRRYF